MRVKVNVCGVEQGKTLTVGNKLVPVLSAVCLRRDIDEGVDVWRTVGNYPLLACGTHFPLQHALRLWPWANLYQHRHQVSADRKERWCFLFGVVVKRNNLSLFLISLSLFLSLSLSLSPLLSRNLRRTVEVWMDEYKEVFYRAQPHARDVEYGK